MTAARKLETPEFRLRPAAPTDRGMIFSSWLSAPWEAEPLSKLPRELYMPLQENHIEACMRRARTVAICHVDAPDELFGFVCLEQAGRLFCVHWMYVKNMWRKQGIARAVLRELVPEGATLFTSALSRHTRWVQTKGVLVYPYGVTA